MILSHYQAAELLEQNTREPGSVELSLDLNLSRTTVHWDGNCLTRGDIVVTREQLEEIRKEENACYYFSCKENYKVHYFSESSGHFYSLYPTPEAPSLLNAGFPMHRIKDVYPWQDTKTKINAARPIKGMVLDTCTGLGYTAIQASRFADHVRSIEIDPAVHWIAKRNPWSAALFESNKIDPEIGSCEEIVANLEENSLDVVLHDPPSVSLAGELYSARLYCDFFRILKRGGTLFHYIGDPTSKLGQRTTRGVIERLQNARFRSIRPHPAAFGVAARK